MARCVIGTRGSSLALTQTAEVMGKLGAVFKQVDFERLVIRTSGDVRTDVPLAAVGGEGVFVKELELALERGEIDVAVHSLKDLPTSSPQGLVLAATLPRVDPRDALISATARRLADIPDGAVIGTGSLRRRAQLAMLNSTWRYAEARGNLETRLAKLDAGQFDALILACAGLDRLGHSARIADRLPYSALLPAPGQATIAVQVRAEDAATREMVGALDDLAARAAVTAERALLREVEGGCQVPLGALATVAGDQLTLEAVLASLDGRRHIRKRLDGPIAKPEALGITLGRELLAEGGRDILAEVRVAR
jgi:hydroxymethylbilane synthase